jgi:hypothetical protein
MQSTFFESLMLADAERIHSQTLAWILNLHENVFPKQEKNKLFKTIFNLSHDIIIEDNYFIGTEINSLDIVIRTDETTLVIENKLKSSEHSFQSDKYLNALPGNLRSKEENTYFAFLSLTAESPKNPKWIIVSFEKLLKSLQTIKWNKEDRSYVFIDEYIKTLENLVGTFNHFMLNHHEYETVFLDGHKKKHEKDPEDEKYKSCLKKDYIRKNQLETIFQKAFIKKVISDLDLEDYHISETHGVALLQVNRKKIILENKPFLLGFQFQGNTLKINFAREEYGKSRANQITNEMINAFELVFKNKNGFTRLNKPKTKAYMSVSKKLDKQLFEYNTDELKVFIQTILDNLNILLSEFESKLKEFAT